MRSSEWAWFVKNVIGKISFRLSGYPSFPMADYHKIDRIIDEATEPCLFTFASTDASRLSSLMIRKVVGGGVFTHAGIIMPRKEGHEILHLTTEGVVKQDLLEILKESDFICINKVSFESVDNYIDALHRIDFFLKNSEKIKYDFAQDLNNGLDKFYCSEVIHYVLNGLVDDVDLKPSKVYSVDTFPPDSVTKLGDIVYSNNPYIGKEHES